MLVIDSGAALRACSSAAARAQLGAHQLIAPPLLWSEVTSTIHAALWRREIDEVSARHLRTVFDELRIARRVPARLYAVACDIAEELGWAKTYDAEFLALARLRDCRLLTTDARLRRGADRTGLVIDPTDL